MLSRWYKDSMTERPDERNLEIREIDNTPGRAGRESTIGDNSKQNTWEVAKELAHKDDIHPSEVEGIKAIDSFGIDFGDGTIATSKGVVEKNDDTTLFQRPAKQAVEPMEEPHELLKSKPYDSAVTINIQITNVPEVTDAVQIEDLGKYSYQLLESGAAAVKPVKEWLMEPNAVNKTLGEFGSAIGTAVNYYASTSPEQISRDIQSAMGTVAEAVEDKFSHSMTPDDRAKLAGTLLPVFFFEGDLRKPIDPRTVEQMGLEKMAESELKALGVESKPAQVILERDEFSLQGKIVGDEAAFIRATVPEPGVVVVDSIFKGTLPSGSDFLAEMLKSSNAIPSQKLVFSSIMNPETLEAFRRGIPAADSLLGRSGTRALENLGIEPRSYRYEVVRGKLNLVIETQ